MGYMHIKNLYADNAIQAFRECYALEKIHGTSAHVSWDGNLHFFSGGSKYETFCAFFDHDELKAKFEELGHPEITVYGEAYGGKIQGMSETYGPSLFFTALEVKIGDTFLAVPNAESVCEKLGIEFVPYSRIATDTQTLDAERDAYSVVAQRRGASRPKAREGIVLRPLFEVIRSNGERIIAKHKAAEFCETKTPRVVGDNPAAIEGVAVATEWVTPMRMTHILDALGNPTRLEDIPRVIAAMIEDVLREGDGEVADTKETRKAISRAAAKVFKEHLAATLQ